jgi:hypothetical protein
MEPATTPNTSGVPHPNPPSVEAAYKRKCIQLKKRLNEIESENDVIRNRNKRSMAYIQKMRLESCILLERLAKVTGMMEEAGSSRFNPELRARAAAVMSNTYASNDGRVLDDETEGSSEEQPPTVYHLFVPRLLTKPMTKVLTDL